MLLWTNVGTITSMSPSFQTIEGCNTQSITHVDASEKRFGNFKWQLKPIFKPVLSSLSSTVPNELFLKGYVVANNQTTWQYIHVDFPLDQILVKKWNSFAIVIKLFVIQRLLFKKWRRAISFTHIHSLKLKNYVINNRSHWDWKCHL